jgi:hypothetical protein
VALRVNQCWEVEQRQAHVQHLQDLVIR